LFVVGDGRKIKQAASRTEMKQAFLVTYK